MSNPFWTLDSIINPPLYAAFSRGLAKLEIQEKSKSHRSGDFAFLPQVANHAGEQMYARCVILQNRRESKEFAQRFRAGSRSKGVVEADAANERHFKL